MRTVDGIQVFTLSEVVVGELFAKDPSMVELEAREWCQRNDAVFGVGELESLVTEARSSSKEKIVLAAV